jgi:hypothetical protein
MRHARARLPWSSITQRPVRTSVPIVRKGIVSLSKSPCDAASALRNSSVSTSLMTVLSTIDDGICSMLESPATRSNHERGHTLRHWYAFGWPPNTRSQGMFLRIECKLSGE